ncbi:MAG: heat-inducible transcriptional repressor HrcA [Pyrinomonadaceae bacterium]
MSIRPSETKLTNETFSIKREQFILSAIIEEHLATGEPVGSKSVSEHFTNAVGQSGGQNLGMSSATIRNVMSELEESGLLKHPHTSAGRVPTDAGYRFYVDNLLGILQISAEDLSLINEHLGIPTNDIMLAPERFLERTSQLLSNLSKNVGIVVSPSLAENRLQHIKFVNLADKRILVIMVSEPNLVHHKVIQLEQNLLPEELERTANYLNAEFAGKSLNKIRSEILNLMHDEKLLFDKMLQTAMILCNESLHGESEDSGAVYVDGASNIISQPDFADFSKLRELLRTFEEKSRLVQILNECIRRDQNLRGGTAVIIGSENLAPSLQNCALITAPYRLGKHTNAVGTLTVLGPTRIEYARMIAVVSYLARLFENVLTAERNG